MVTARDDVDSFAATEFLRAALDQARIVLLSPGVDVGSPALGLVELRRVRADVTMPLAEALRHGGDE